MKRNAAGKIQRMIKSSHREKDKRLKVPDGERPYIGNVPVLKVSEACELLEIEVPKSYFKYRDHYIIDTPFMLKKMAKDKDFSPNLKFKKKTSEQYYKGQSLRVRRGKRFKDKYIDNAKLKRSDEKMLQYFIHWYCVFLPMQYSIGNYFAYELYKKPISEAKKFASRGYLDYLAQVLVIPEYRKYLNNKSLFNKTFAKHVNRDFLHVGAARTRFEDFDQFVSKNPRFIAKPVTGMMGRGIEIIESAGSDKELFERLQDEDFVVESIVEQHSEIAEFNPDTLNTIRVTTFLPIDNNPIVTFAGIRFGRKGSFVDNLCAGGLTASIDVETGEIMTTGIDQDSNRFSRHPDSGKRFEGFEIPNWEKVLVSVKESATVLPQVRRIGWDVAITSEGEVEFIEGNSKPAFRMTQITDQVGKKHLYERHVQVLVDSDWKNDPRMRESVKGLKSR